MFQIVEMTEAHVASVTNRTEAHGDERVPAVSIGLEMTVPNTMLDLIDASIRHALYKAVEGQDELPGVDPSTPVLRCNSFDQVALTTAHEGWTLKVDDGIDDTQPMTFGGCKVDKFKVEAKQGGSVELRFRVGTSDIDAERLGKLGMHNGGSIWITLTPPAKDSGPLIDGSNEDFERGHPDATDLFADGGGDDGQEQDGSDGGEPPSGDGEAADFEAGAAAAIQKAGKGRRGRRVADEVE